MGKMFDEILNKIEINKQIKEKGGITSILPPFPRLAKLYPGFEKGKYFIITASSGIGKTKFTKFFTITSIYNFIKLNPSVKVRIKYFALEETESEFWLSFLSTMLYEKFNIQVSTTQLKSLGEYTVSDETLEKIKECQDYIDELSKFIEVIDYIHNGFGIYKNVREYFNNSEIGEHAKIKLADNTEITTGYKHKDPDIYHFIITDHISLLSPETVNGAKMDLRESIGHFSKEYCLKGFCKRYNCVVINVQQQSAEKEKLEFHQGNTIDQKMEPSLDGLANNKETQRDADVILGLFAPARYAMQLHRKYDITKLGDNYRSLKFLKDRHYGCANLYIPLYFNGAATYFEELPVHDHYLMEGFYKKK
jgi:replicative DNA helicase